MLARARLYFQFFWIVLFGVFLMLSAPTFFRGVWVNKIGPIDPNHSIDNYLQGLTGIPNGSKSLSDALDNLDATKPLIVFVNQQSSASNFLGMLVSYLAWPRDARIVNVHASELDREVASLRAGSIAGVVFCSINPPAGISNVTRLGQRIILVPPSSLEAVQ